MPAIRRIGGLALVVCALPAYLAGAPQPSEPAGGRGPDQYRWAPGEAHRTFKVFSLADAGPGTLREAILAANSSRGYDRIVFQSEDDLFKQPQTIYLESPLPPITDHLLIDGFIEDMLWKASGVTLSGNKQYRLFEVKANTSLTVEYLTIAEGRAAQGGGMLNNGELLAKGVTFQGNSASGNGGAIHNSGTLYLINSTLANNSAGGLGGGLYNHAGRAVITNATFAWNAANAGGALYNQGQIQLSNTILAGSEGAADCVSTTEFDTHSRRNIVESHQGCGTPFFGDDPRLGELGYYNGPTMTIPIAGNSPAVNWGSNDLAVDPLGEALVWDQRGNGDPRFAAGITDIGAFESQPQILLEVDTPDDADKRWCSRGVNDCSLIGALQIASRSKGLSTISFDAEIFSRPMTLTLGGPLPEIINPVTLDASGLATINIQLPVAHEQLPAVTEHLVLKNVVITGQK